MSRNWTAAQIATAERMGVVSDVSLTLAPPAFEPRYKLTPKGEAVTAASSIIGTKGSSNLHKTTPARNRGSTHPSPAS
jgi:hypothetical protein